MYASRKLFKLFKLFDRNNINRSGVLLDREENLRVHGHDDSSCDRQEGDAAGCIADMKLIVHLPLRQRSAGMEEVLWV